MKEAQIKIPTILFYLNNRVRLRKEALKKKKKEEKVVTLK